MPVRFVLTGALAILLVNDPAVAGIRGNASPPRTLSAPGNFTDKDFYSEWPIAIRLNGSYHNLALFFDRVGRFSRIVNIENLKIAALPTVGPVGHSISATFTAKTFIYREAPPPEPVAPKKGKKPAAKPEGMP